MTRPSFLLVFALVAIPVHAFAAPPTALEILSRADDVMAPFAFESDVELTSHKGNSPDRVINVHVWKQGMALARIRVLSPPDEAGQEVLRDGDALWNYLPNLKRALRISAKQEFHGGDFNNTDMLRVNLSVDYNVTMLPSESPDEYLLELRAKNDAVSYDVIKYSIRKSDFVPLRQDFYTKSGKLIRKLELTEPKLFGKHLRPSHLIMKNMMAPNRSTELVVKTFIVKKKLDDSIFQLSSLGR